MAKGIVVELNAKENKFEFHSNIKSEMELAQLELYTLDENINSIKLLKAECDKVDYALAVSAGAMCGIIDIFLVGKPGKSPLGDITDKWFENRTKDFAKLCGWNGSNSNSSSAIRYLEEKFKVPYDQRGAGDAGQFINNLNPKNHHFKSLAHNPSLLGLFFSILDQFTNQSHFVTGGELISLQRADDSFELQGKNIPSKLFSGITNWIGHLVSDVSGSSGSKGRGMGIPSPLWTWTNDVIAIKKKLNIPVSKFDQSVNNLALEIFNQGYDARFQATQALPVIINELVVRFFYSIRRLVKYFSETRKEDYSLKKSWEDYSFKELWRECEPFSNVTVKRMLTVAHGTFCLIDLGDATARGFASAPGFRLVEFVLRVNIVGVGRFTISLYGEIKRGASNNKNERILYKSDRERIIVKNYIEGLEILSDEYDDTSLKTLIKDFSNSEVYLKAFNASIELADKRHVPKEKVLYSKQEGDEYFRGGRK